MSNRAYRLLFGTLLLIFLYLDLHWLIWALIALLLIDGVIYAHRPQAVTAALNRLSGCGPVVAEAQCPTRTPPTGNMDAEQVWRLLAGSLLLLSDTLFHHRLWFFPWFMGFTLFGAGVSGVCPMLIGIKGLGFK